MQFQQGEIVAQAMKFDHFLANLTQEIVTKVRDLLMNPPEDNLYDVLQLTVIKGNTVLEQR